MILEMENGRMFYKSSLTHPSSRQNQSGHELSDTETDQESPWRAELLISKKSKTFDPARTICPFSVRSKTPDPARTISPISNRSKIPDPAGTINQISSRSKMPDPPRTMSPLNQRQGHTIRENNNSSANMGSRTSPVIRRHIRSPYKAIRHDIDGVTSEYSGLRRNTSPSKISEHHSKHVSPYRARREEADCENNELNCSFQKLNKRKLSMHQGYEEMGDHLQPQGVSRMSERSHEEMQQVSQLSEMSNYNRSRSMPAQNPRAREQEKQANSGDTTSTAVWMPSPTAQIMIHKENYGSYAKNCTPYELNERIANMKLSKSSSANALMQSTESISIDDIFISHNYTDPQKGYAIKNGDNGNNFAQQFKMFPEKNKVVHQLNRVSESFIQNPEAVPVSTVLSQTNTSSTSTFGQASISRSSTYSGKLSASSGKLSLSGSFKKFTASRQKGQTDTWLSCVSGGSCTKTKSPDSRATDEAFFIERAIVVEELSPFWADKHRPRSLCEFICHKQQAQHLQKLMFHNNCPHILLRGPSGSGKKSLSMALLHQLFGDSLKENRPEQIAIPLISSPHHLILNLKSELKNARDALMAFVKEITDERATAPEISDVSFKADYKVIILYDVDKVDDSIQNLVRWIMDRYTDTCKMILCCEDDVYILESVKTHCELITVDAPVTHEIIEVLIQTAAKENFELSTNFAARIASKSKQNLRKAIMALEACKAHNYPFVDEQPIPLGWEEVLVEVAAEIFAEPSATRLLFVRGKFQKLLVEFVHPRLILQKLVEEFLKGVKSSTKRELFYWHAYYDKRLPAGTSARLKLEEFVAKFMSIYRKSIASGPEFA